MVTRTLENLDVQMPETIFKQRISEGKRKSVYEVQHIDPADSSVSPNQIASLEFLF